MNRVLYLFIPFLLANFFYLQAQETDLFKKDKKNDKFDAGAPIISPVIFPVYTPEAGFMISGGGLLSFKTKRNNPYLYHSTLPVTLGINTKGAFLAAAHFTSYWFDNQLRFYLDTWYRNMDDNYWGVGIENGLDIEEGENTTGYHYEGFRIKPVLLYRVFHSFYAGIQADVNSSDATDLADLMTEDQSVLEYGTDITNSGIGFALEYDSRDFPPNASEGIFINLEGIFYDQAFGGDYNYQVIQFDFRQYLSIIREGSVLAWQLKSRMGYKDVPWTNMSKLGSINDLRGYYWGQFRDRSMLLLLLEYRHSFFSASSMEFSRHGMVFWVGGGTVYSKPQEIKNGIFNIGLGYRYEVQPRMNLRIDVGFGIESAGVYLSFNEAF